MKLAMNKQFLVIKNAQEKYVLNQDHHETWTISRSILKNKIP